LYGADVAQASYVLIGYRRAKYGLRAFEGMTNDLLLIEPAALHVRRLRWRTDLPQSTDVSGEQVNGYPA
jgi:hypothetical protein